MINEYEVIIVGGGPTGIALGIELGLNNIKTLILEKYDNPMLSPRAQWLTERSMEFFMRWGIADKLREKFLFPKGYPMHGVWCSKLNGITYATAGSEEQFAKPVSAQKGIRIPLYITENILRSRLNDFACVTFLKNQVVESIVIKDDITKVVTKNRIDQSINNFQAKYIVGCDGANSITRQSAKISFTGLAPKRRVLNLLFEAPDLAQKITVENGFIYYIMDNQMTSALGVVDLTKGIWYAQIFYTDDKISIEEINIDSLLEEHTGLQFEKKILDAHFWDMQIQLADNFVKNNHVFLVGDSAHAFAPTGGLGLNTGLGDVTNLAWKIASVIHKHTSEKILSTYEIERRPVALRNLQAAEKNAADAVTVRTKFPPKENPEAFANENARIAKQHAHSLGLTLGYTYNQNEKPMTPSIYTPTEKLGYFLPHIEINGKSIYEKLSPILWTLIVCGKEKINFQKSQFNVLYVPENTYLSKYILIRPDWHIAYAGDNLNSITESSFASRQDKSRF